VIFDGLKSWEDRLRIFVDGREAKLKFNQRNFFMLSGGTRNTLKIGAGGGPQFRFRGALDEVRIYSRALDTDEIAALACADSLEKIAAIPAADRSRAQALKIHGAFLEQAAPNELKQARDTLVELKRQKQSFEDDLPTLMVMKETRSPRPTFLLKRGERDVFVRAVERGVQQLFGRSQARRSRHRRTLDFGLTGHAAQCALVRQFAQRHFTYRVGRRTLRYL